MAYSLKQNFHDFSSMVFSCFASYNLMGSTWFYWWNVESSDTELLDLHGDFFSFLPSLIFYGIGKVGGDCWWGISDYHNNKTMTQCMNWGVSYKKNNQKNYWKKTPGKSTSTKLRVKFKYH